MPHGHENHLSRDAIAVQGEGQAVEVVIDGTRMIAAAREFSTGSLGWNISNKMTIMVGATPVTVQVGFNLTVVGSKELAKDAPA